MPDDEDVLLPFQLHDNGFETNHYISIRFTTCAAVKDKRGKQGRFYPPR